MTGKEKIDTITEMRFKKHMRPCDIAKKLEVSKSYITKVIKKDKRYFKEKEKQREENRQKNKEKAKAIIYAKREKERQERENLKLKHNQATKELSHEVRMTTDNNRRCNPKTRNSKYKYFGCRAG